MGFQVAFQPCCDELDSSESRESHFRGRPPQALLPDTGSGQRHHGRRRLRVFFEPVGEQLGRRRETRPVGLFALCRVFDDLRHFLAVHTSR